MASVQSLSAGEKFFICSFVQEGLLEGESSEELTLRRKWLAEKFSQTLPVISAVTAHLRIRAQQVIQHRLSNDQVNDIAESLIGIGGIDRKATQIGKAFELGIEPIFIEAASDGVLPVEMVSVNDGESVSYENSIKEKWRETWGKFLSKHTQENERREMKVICLPGAECREIPLYLDLGFQASNIVGVEGGSRLTRAVFESNARKYGITTYVGELEAYLKECKEKFDVVSLDFHGQHSLRSVAIIRNLPLSDKAIVMTNTMGKRERTEVQALMEYAPTRISYHRQSEAMAKHRIQEERNRVLQDLGLAPEPMPTPPLALQTQNLTKNRNSISMAMMNIGYDRSELWMHGPALQRIVSNKALQKAAPVNLQPLAVINLLQRLAEGPLVWLTGALNSLGILDCNSERDLQKVKYLGRLISDTVIGASKVKDLQKWSYRSASGSGTSTFMTDMALLERPIVDYQKLSRLTEFILSIINNIAKDLGSPSGDNPIHFVIGNDKKKRKKPCKLGTFNLLDPHGEWRNSDYLTAVETTPGGEAVCIIDALQIGYLVDSLEELIDLIETYSLDEWEKQAALTRQVLQLG